MKNVAIYVFAIFIISGILITGLAIIAPQALFNSKIYILIVISAVIVIAVSKAVSE